MYCSKCGAKHDIDSSFCPSCGAPINNPTQVDFNPNDLQQDVTSAKRAKTDALRAYVGKNAEYYINKWQIETGEVKKDSWNWAAFFLGFLWLGYRKMYSVLFALVAVFLVTDVILYAIDVDGSLVNSGIGMGTSVFLGLMGNYFYYMQAEKSVVKNSHQDIYLKDKIAAAGGRSILGVFLAIFMILVYIVISAFILDPVFATPEVEVIEFGYSEMDGEVDDPSSEFQIADEIYYSFYFPSLEGGPYKVVIEKLEGTESLYDQWEDEVPPDWPGVVASMYAPEEAGDYMMKIIQDNEVVAKGEFSVE
ncbi:DUF2628 domain-containing protein [Bacillus tianshenii]|uniref:DUF2628 domain-containing protein n=1 Tax=Sutcliffiella tianshenii TaxID=1463404 RepID=UPI001CD7B832|nr:DUF2628 domain-containing protein [Bacillus tianshenii]MCA1321477.1 DUF2628 domain-containing protein [Bacillus tianshenii]